MTQSTIRRAWPFALLVAGAAALFLSGLGRLPLFERDEALYAEAGREMLVSGDWITPNVNGGPFLEKPPLYYWMAATSYRMLGVSPFSARLPAALMAILTVALVTRIGARAWGRRAGLFAGLALATSLQMAMIGRMGIMDVPLTCLTVLALLAYERWYNGGRLLGAAAFGACVGSAVLLKGAAGLIPVGVVAVDLAVRVVRKERAAFSWVHVVGAALLVCSIAALIAAPWFVAMSARHGEEFGSTLFLHEHVKRILQPMQGHGGQVWVYLPLILVSFFPWVMFLPAGMARRDEETEAARFWRVLAVVWILAVLVPFSLVSTKLPGYVTPLFPAMALLVGAELRRGPKRRVWIAVLTGSLVLAGLVCLLPSQAARLGERVGASGEARLLVAPVVAWVVGYLVIAGGSAGRLLGRERAGVPMLAIGQVTAIGALLFGVLPVLSPYLGGGSVRLAELARREMPGRRIVLYETHPENVNFALGETVLTFDQHQRRQLGKQLSAGPTALIAPLRDSDVWQALPADRVVRSGDRVLLDIPKLDGVGGGGP